MPEAVRKNWGKIAAGYARADWPRALWQLANTLIPFFVLWFAVWQLSEISWWLVPPVSLLASGFLMRCFIVQHDCGHCSWSPDQKFNNWVGRFLGVLTFTPYAYWRRIHGIHHATNGDLDNRIAGDIPTITVDEYLGREGWGRLRYRIFRNPIVLFVIGPIYQFLFKYRFPVEGLPAPVGPCLRSAMWTNLGIVGFLALLDPIMGWQKALTIHVALLLPGLALGVWLFYIQHNFEESYWRRHEEWDYATAALKGSSYYRMPRLLNWLTGDIAVHHVHHLSARIPNYRLREMMADHPELENVSRVEFLESFRCAFLTLWDEETNQMVNFATAHEREREHSVGVGEGLNPPAAPSASEPA
ncbi:MAG: fatty acid desaturase [Deltaproteobacteria bacterium]|nr:fatty acid desaturase [Deltaproteobacteria bacterium]